MVPQSPPPPPSHGPPLGRGLSRQFSRRFSGRLAPPTSLMQCISGRQMREIRQIDGPFASCTPVPFQGTLTLEIPHKYHGQKALRSGRRSTHTKSKRAAASVCTLEECLAHAAATETLEGANQFALPSGGMVDAELSVKFDGGSLPKVLLLHLNRTSWATGACRKVDAHVAVPMVLDLRRFSKAAQGCEDEDTSYDYRLHALVQHEGRGMDQGHYTAYGLVPNSALVGGSTGSSWWFFNDQRVSNVTAEDVLSASAYLLFYERIEPWEQT